MEPFGLLHFLQTLLQNPPMGDQNCQNSPAEPTASPASFSPSATPNLSSDNRPQNTAEKAAEKPSSSQEACLLFLQEHDRRSERVKKR